MKPSVYLKCTCRWYCSFFLCKLHGGHPLGKMVGVGKKLGGKADAAKQATCSWVTREFLMKWHWQTCEILRKQQEGTKNRYGTQTMGSASLHTELKGWMTALDSIPSHLKAIMISLCQDLTCRSPMFVGHPEDEGTFENVSVRIS